MRLKRMRLSNFESFGPVPETIEWEAVTFLVGPNGSGKTAVLRALCRLFSIDKQFRYVRESDFHVSSQNEASTSLWIEADFDFPELADGQAESPAIPDHYKHLRLEVSNDSAVVVRIRLSASIDEDGEIDERLQYVIKVDEDDEPTESQSLSRFDRSKIQVHYLPARRDPAEHIAYGAATLIGRILRACDWSREEEQLKILSDRIGEELLAANPGAVSVSERLRTGWEQLHKGTHYQKPSLSFEGANLDLVLRNLSVSFSPGHGSATANFALLSDGQQSLLYLSLALCAQSIYADVLSGELTCFNAARLRPPTFSMLAMEEPENSLSPHYLGRVVAALEKFASGTSAQAAVATHAPSMLRRVSPENVRYLRLNETRETTCRTVILPIGDADARKFVKEAVKAYPELYFSRLVVLGEGDSESIVIPRLLKAAQQGEDDASISVAPLGGRHVNHFWRLLHGLQIPHVTLLDLDAGRHQAGWGRVRYALKQLALHNKEAGITDSAISKYPKWDDPLDFVHQSDLGKRVIAWLEQDHRVFFSSPLDLDYSMLIQFEGSYDVEVGELGAPTAAVITSVLGKSAVDARQYSADQQKYFAAYHRIFKLESKPIAHLAALSVLTDQELLAAAPQSLTRMMNTIQTMVRNLPE